MEPVDPRIDRSLSGEQRKRVLPGEDMFLQLKLAPAANPLMLIQRAR